MIGSFFPSQCSPPPNIPAANGDPSNDPENVVSWREHGSVTNEECFGGDLAGITDKLDYLQNLGIIHGKTKH